VRRPRSRSRGLFFLHERPPLTMIAAMPTHISTFHLDASPERVFDFIADARNETDWSKDIKTISKRGDGPVGEGTVFDADYRGFGRLEMALRDYRRPEHLAFLAEGPRIWMHFILDVAPEGDGSSVTMSVDMRLRGALRLLTPLLALGIPREMAKRPGQLGAALDA
jgi:uncharacterized protein YndB with AHSA1/START domain